MPDMTHTEADAEPWQVAQENAELLEALRHKLTRLAEIGDELRPHVTEPADELAAVFFRELRNTAEGADLVLFPLIVAVRRHAAMLKANAR